MSLIVTKVGKLSIESNALFAVHRSHKLNMTKFLENRYCLCVLLICEGGWSFVLLDGAFLGTRISSNTKNDNWQL